MHSSKNYSGVNRSSYVVNKKMFLTNAFMRINGEFMPL